MPSSCPKKTFLRVRMNILLVIIELHVASSKVKLVLLLIYFAIVTLCSFLRFTSFVFVREEDFKNPHICILSLFWYFLGDSLN